MLIYIICIKYDNTHHTNNINSLVFIKKVKFLLDNYYTNKDNPHA